MPLTRGAQSTPRRRIGGWLLRLACLVLSADLASAQKREPVHVDSGPVESTTAGPAVVFTNVVHIPGAPWLRIDFERVTLAGRVSDGNAAFLRLTSVRDGGVQLLYSEHLEQWQYSSAYFNGDAVAVEIVAWPGTGPSSVQIKEVLAGQPDTPRDRSLCGTTDQRTLSSDARIGRGQTQNGQARCTAWIINDCNRCLVTAGHCTNDNLRQVHFNVPLSDANGNVQFPPPADQYAIDLTSWNALNIGLGSDWAYFGCFPNPVTGLTPAEKQNSYFELTLTPPPADGRQVRVTGYGNVALNAPPPPNTWNRTQKTHVGSYDSLSGTTIRHKVDTTDGNSGSPIIDMTTGLAIGIHTNGGCEIAGASNGGTAFSNVPLQDALAAPRGTCAPLLETLRPVADWAYVRSGASERVVQWPPPLPLSFALVADPNGILGSAAAPESLFSSVTFSGGGASCTDATPPGGPFDCTVAALGGRVLFLTQGKNAWNQPVSQRSTPVLLLRSYTQQRTTCWLAGTRITMADGTRRAIETLVAGDSVRAYSLVSGTTMAARVAQVITHTPQEMGDHYLLINGTIRVTPDHLLLVDGALRFAEDVQPGQALRSESGASVAVTSVDRLFETATTYNIELSLAPQGCAPFYAYLAEDIVAYPLKGDVALQGARLLYDYDMHNLGALAGQLASTAYGVNNNGTVVGASGSHAFSWTFNGGLVDLGLGVARAVNLGGVAAGDRLGRAVTWSPAGALTDLTAGVAWDINNNGVVVGESGGQAFRWSAGQLTLLGPGAAYAVNANGYAAGTSNGRAVIWSPTGQLTDLGVGIAYDLNVNLHAAGTSGGQAVVWRNGQTTVLGPGTARSINGFDQVVGQTSGGGFTWTPTGGVKLLLDSIWRWTGWNPNDPRCVSDVGQIVGGGTIGGVTRAFQATFTQRSVDANGNAVPDVCELGAIDCNNNGVPDDLDISGGLSEDCNGNAVPDECDIAQGITPDCNNNGQPDSCDIAEGLAQDCNGNTLPDACELAANPLLDCNGNSVIDTCEIATNPTLDCNGNARIDACEVAADPNIDCNGNGKPDSCDIASGQAQDCNGNGKPDSCDIASGQAQDCNGNGRPDSCDIASGQAQDCNGNGKPDSCDIASGQAQDCNGNGKPDSCDIASGTASDCNNNGIPDSCDVIINPGADCNHNGIPDSCDLASGQAQDCNGNGKPDSCDIASGTAPDCDGNGVPDNCDLAAHPERDCDQNGRLDSCDIAGGQAQDCNGNGKPDSCDLASGLAQDCNGNGKPDSCDIASGVAKDCNGNGKPDSCDIANGTAQDADGNGIPDSCQTLPQPDLPAPRDRARGLDTDVTLSARAWNAYGGPMTVRFYGWLPGELALGGSAAGWQGGTPSGTTVTTAGKLVLVDRFLEAFGDGRDGDLTVPTGTTFVLPPGKFYNDVTVNLGGTIDTRGNTLRGNGQLVNQGLITDTLSGGAAGAGGNGGQGQDPRQNTNPPGPAAAQPGQCSTPGQPGAAGGGRGGDGGGGGGGGGGAQWNGGSIDTDGGWTTEVGNASKRGRGGNGGRGGGVVRVYCAHLVNYGQISADGQAGQEGQAGGNGNYSSTTGREMAGGGGGGGAGGGGGDGGIAEVKHVTFDRIGLINALGGAGGAGGAGGIGRTLSGGTSNGSSWPGAGGACGGGNGGNGEHRAGQVAAAGGNGADGAWGADGVASRTVVQPGYASSGSWQSAPLCAGATVEWTGVQVVASTPAGTSVALAFSPDGAQWYSQITDVPDSNCIIVRVSLTSNNPNVTPEVTSVEVTYARPMLLSTVAGVASGSRPRFQWSGLTPATHFRWYMTVSNSVGFSNSSPEWSFDTAAAANNRPVQITLPVATP